MIRTRTRTPRIMENVGSRLKTKISSIKLILIYFSFFFPWSGTEKSVYEILDPLVIVIKNVAILTQWLTHVRKTKFSVRKMSEWCLKMITDGLYTSMWRRTNVWTILTLTISRNISEINRKQNTGSSLSGKTDQYPDSWRRRVRGSEMWKEGRNGKSVCLTGELATFRQKCPLTSFRCKTRINLYSYNFSIEQVVTYFKAKSFIQCSIEIT